MLGLLEKSLKYLYGRIETRKGQNGCKKVLAGDCHGEVLVELRIIEISRF